MFLHLQYQFRCLQIALTAYTEVDFAIDQNCLELNDGAVHFLSLCLKVIVFLKLACFVVLCSSMLKETELPFSGAHVSRRNLTFACLIISNHRMKGTSISPMVLFQLFLLECELIKKLFYHAWGIYSIQLAFNC